MRALYGLLTMKLKHLAPKDFDRLAQNTRLGERAREMARAVLVDGRSLPDVGTEYGMSKQRVHSAVGTIERAFAAATTPGAGIVGVLLEFPEGLALELASLADALKVCKSAARSSNVVANVIKELASAREKLINPRNTEKLIKPCNTELA